MSRTCVYLVNEHPLYTKMVCNSIFMLRSYNRTIPVKVFFIRDGGVTTHNQSIVPSPPTSFNTPNVLSILQQLDAQVLEVDTISRPGLENYFFTNRLHFGTLTEESVLHIDGDTMIFDDVEKLFDESEMKVPVSKWYIQNKLDCVSSFGRNVPPFNAAIMLFNNGLCQKWAGELEHYIERTKQSTWYRRNQDPLEEIATNWWACDNVKNMGYFSPKEVFPVEKPDDLISPPRSIIVHTYVQQWQTLYQSLGKPLEAAIWNKSRMFKTKRPGQK